MGVDGQLRVVEPQLLHADLVEVPAEAHDLARWQKPVAAGDDQMRVFGQARADAADEAVGALVSQEMEIVQKEIVGCFPGGKRPAELLHHAPGAGLVAREVECIQHVEPRVPEGVLRASP